ncbi:MAG TPA: hypothetical protein VNJ71_14535 [Gemmatimonadales bacterium]|jgi:aspartate kinase|nr:hypothetical protein [Gemmatimonadales bacterium]
MTRPLIVIKLGGDALATAERIAAQAGRLARRARTERVVAVASARRGVTDHLVTLVERVQHAVGAVPGSHPEADRAIAAGEVVSASLLSLALEGLGCRAVSLDAREAGLSSDGRFGTARLTAVDPAPIRRLLDQGVIPVVTGFQGWYEGRVTTLPRGGSDCTAVSLAISLGAERCDLVKESGGLYTADPRLVPEARPLRSATHQFLTALAEAGAQVMQPEAAMLAEQAGLPLWFLPLDHDEPVSAVSAAAGNGLLRGVAVRRLSDGVSAVTAVAAQPVAPREWDRLTAELAAARLEAREVRPAPARCTFRLPADTAARAARLIHAAFVGEPHACAEPAAGRSH